MTHRLRRSCTSPRLWCRDRSAVAVELHVLVENVIGLVNVVDLRAGGLGNLGNEQLEWLEDDLKGRAPSTPIVVFAHIPLWYGISSMGLGHRRCGARSRLS